MDIKMKRHFNTLVVTLKGELDAHYAGFVREKIDNEILNSKVKNLIFDFSRLEFMDSSGIGVIIGRYKSIKAVGGKVIIVKPNRQIKRIIDISGIQKLIPVNDNLDEAIKKLL
ncbi:MAG: anti-sigma F factor antagonist [Clostridiaceae bacterium]|nr:anti-sigma F factor antagonist [Clostridiaceae bacterium]